MAKIRINELCKDHEREDPENQNKEETAKTLFTVESAALDQIVTWLFQSHGSLAQTACNEYNIHFFEWVPRDVSKLHIFSKSFLEVMPKGPKRFIVKQMFTVLFERIFASKWSEAHSNKDLMGVMLGRGGLLLSSESLRFVRALKNTYIGLYRIHRVEPEHLILKDLVHCENEAFLVRRNSDINCYREGCTIGVRVITWEGEKYITNCYLHFPGGMQEVVRADAVSELLEANCFDEGTEAYGEVVSQSVWDTWIDASAALLDLLGSMYVKEDEDDVSPLKNEAQKQKQSEQQKAEQNTDQDAETKRLRLPTIDVFADAYEGGAFVPFPQEIISPTDKIIFEDLVVVVEVYAVADWDAFQARLRASTDIRRLCESVWDYDGRTVDQGGRVLSFFEKTPAGEVNVVCVNLTDAQAMRAVLGARFGSDVTFVRRESKTLYEYFTSMNTLERVSEAPALVDQYKERWRTPETLLFKLDEPHGLLRDKTPRQAVKLRSFRPKVAQLLTRWQLKVNDEARILGWAPLDVSFLWRELGLTRPKKGP